MFPRRIFARRLELHEKVQHGDWYLIPFARKFFHAHAETHGKTWTENNEKWFRYLGFYRVDHLCKSSESICSLSPTSKPPEPTPSTDFARRLLSLLNYSRNLGIPLYFTLPKKTKPPVTS